MNRLSKILSLVLLLALVISAFGIFAAFAEDTATSSSEIVTLFDLETEYDKNAGTKGYWAKASFTDGTDNPKKYPNFQEKTGAGDKSRWFTYGFDGWDPSVPYPSNYNSTSTSHIIEIKPDIKPHLADSTDGSTYKRDTDFLVFDFDYAVTESMIKNLKFNMNYVSNGGGSLKDGLTSIELSEHPEGNNFSIKVKGTTCYTKTNSDGWVNITIIVDATGNAAANTQYAYVFIDGVYVGSVSATGAGYFNYCRLQAQVNATPAAPNEAVSFANFTIKQFPVGYEGTLADYSARGLLGKASTTLDAIPDLAYCLSGLPENSKVAEVVHADGTGFTADSVSELDANLKDGDTVTLYKKITTTLLVPTGANITWVDNGFGTPATVEFDFDSADWVLRNRDGTLYDATSGFGKQVYSEELSDTVGITDVTLVTDSLHTYMESNSLVDRYVTVLNDIQTFYYWKGSAKRLSKHLVYDLNGHTWYFNPSTATLTGEYFNMANGGVLSVRNGNLIKTGAKMLHSDANYTSIVLFEDIYMELLTDTMSDCRGGAIVYDNCVVDGGYDADGERVGASAALASFRSQQNHLIIGGLRSSDVLLSSKLDDGVFYIASTAKSGTSQRYGSASVSFSIVDSTASAKYLFETDLYSNTASETVTNNSDVTYSVYNSDVTAYDRAFDIKLNDYTTQSAAAPDTMIVKNNIFVENTKMNAPVINNDEQPTASKIQAGIDEGKAYEYTTNIYLKNVDYSTPSDGEYALLDNPAGRELGTINLNILGDVRTDMNRLVCSGQPTSNVKVNYNGTAWANSSNTEYPYIFTANYDTYTYQLGNDEPVAFFWNKGETADIDRVVTLAKETALYKYTWDIKDKAYTAVLNKNFTFGVNLTLRRDININIFLPEGVTPGAIELKINGVLAEHTVFEGKNKIVVPNIDPTKAADVFAITGTVNGAYGDSVAINGEISVLDYIAKAYDKDEDLLQAVLNYIVAAAAYAGEELVIPEGIGATAVPEAVYGDKKAPVAGDVITGVEMVLDGGFKWVITTTADSAKATYTVDGVAQENAAVSVKNGKIVLNLKAEDLLGDVVVTAGGETVTFNYAWYVEGAVAEDAAVAELLAAIHAYATEAAAYNAN